MMIKINLLPQENIPKTKSGVRTTEKKDIASMSVSIDKVNPQTLILIVPLVFILLIFGHLYLFSVGVLRMQTLRSLKAKWEATASQRKELEEFNAEFSLLSQDNQQIQQILLQRINWAYKLHTLSVLLPDGVWLENLSFSNNEFYLRGKAVSLDKKEVFLIRSYIDALKNERNFSGNFYSFEISSLQKSNLAQYEVVDFSFTGVTKK